MKTHPLTQPLRCAALFLCALLFPGTLNAAARTAPQAAVPLPKYWTWVSYSERRDWNAYFTRLTDTGLKGILLQGSPAQLEKVIPLARQYGVTVFAWVWVMNNGGIAREHPEWLDYNREGYSLAEKKAYVDYYKFLSPIIPGVRKAIYEQMKRYAEVEGLGGISLDYCRYVDQILPTSLWPTYGIVQDREYAEWDYGYHPDMLRAFEKRYHYNPLEKGETIATDSLWLQFRLDAVSEVANQIGDIAHRQGLSISASPFPTPEMARRMVRQDWARWRLDAVFPMIYHGFYYGDATWIAQCVRDCVRDKPGPPVYCGLMASDFRRGSTISDEGVHRPTLGEALDSAFAAGATGISFYTFDQLGDSLRTVLKDYIATHP